MTTYLESKISGFDDDYLFGIVGGFAGLSTYLKTSGQST